MVLELGGKQGRSKAPTIQALTSLCSSTRPSPVSWSALKVSYAAVQRVQAGAYLRSMGLVSNSTWAIRVEPAAY